MTVCDKIWRYDIGHYGGMYVDVPSEHYDSFKKMFPKAQFPRRVVQKDVSKDMTPHGEERFHDEFPNSKKYFKVYFADRSKGAEVLDKLLDKCPVAQRSKKYER